MAETEQKRTSRLSRKAVVAGTYVLGVAGLFSATGYFANEAASVPDFNRGDRLENFHSKVSNIASDFSGDGKFVDREADLKKQQVDLSIRDGVNFSEADQIAKLLDELRAKRDEVVLASENFESQLKNSADFKQSEDYSDGEKQNFAFAWGFGMFGLTWTGVGSIIVAGVPGRRPR